MSLIIANYNGARFLGPCLRSLMAMDCPAAALEVLVVDNGSGDDSAALVEREFPRVRWVEHTVNNYTRALNVGGSLGCGELVAFLNNDTVVDRRWLTELVAVMQVHPRAGACGSKILLMDGRLNSTGHVGLPQGYWMDRGFGEPDRGQYDRLEQVESLTGCAVLFRRDALDEAGWFDEDFGMYMEDVDLSLRLRQRAWMLYYVPQSRVQHVFRGTSSEAAAQEYLERNRLLLLAKHRPDQLAPALFGHGYWAYPRQPQPGALLRLVPLLLETLRKHHAPNVLAAAAQSLIAELNQAQNLEWATLVRQQQGREETLVRQQQGWEEELRTVREQLTATLAKLEDLKSRHAALATQLTEHDQRSRLQQAVLEEQLEASRAGIAERDRGLAAHVSRMTSLEEELGRTRQRLGLLRDELGVRDRRLRRLLVIKAQRVSWDQLEAWLREIRLRQPAVRIGLFAHLVPDQFDRVKSSEALDESWLFCPGRRPLSWWSVLATLACCWLRRYDVVVVPWAKVSGYAGFRRAWRLAGWTGARERRLLPLASEEPVMFSEAVAYGSTVVSGQAAQYLLGLTNPGGRPQRVRLQIRCTRLLDEPQRPTEVSRFAATLDVPPGATKSVAVQYDWAGAGSVSSDGMPIPVEAFQQTALPDPTVYRIHLHLTDDAGRPLDDCELFQRVMSP